jgi:hypothetical protein
MTARRPDRLAAVKLGRYDGYCTGGDLARLQETMANTGVMDVYVGSVDHWTAVVKADQAFPSSGKMPTRHLHREVPRRASRSGPPSPYPSI